MERFNTVRTKKSPRIDSLVKDLYAKMPEVEAARAILITESYKETENEPMVMRRAHAFEHILDNIPIIIRDKELIVGSTTLAPRGCQTYPEFSYAWLEPEFETLERREADPFFISDETKEALRKVHPYWKGKTSSELAEYFMTDETKTAIRHNVFTTGNYYYNGVGHITVKYWEIIEKGFEGKIKEIEEELSNCRITDGNYCEKHYLLEAMIISCRAVIRYAERYAALADKMAEGERVPKRKEELRHIAANCRNVPRKGAGSFYEACQTFWFLQQLLQLESSGHSISPGRFDQYMYPYYKKDIGSGRITRDQAQEYLDCVWVKFNDLNKCRDEASAKGFAGYSLFQNLTVGGMGVDGKDATNDLTLMCIWAEDDVHLPAPSLSLRVWNLTPAEVMREAAALTRTGMGMPAYYNDEVIIPSMMARGISEEDARDYDVIGCVEPQKGGKTMGWHDAAFFNMCRPLEFVFSNGYEDGERVSIQTGELSELKTFEDFWNAYKKQMEYQIELLVNSDNSIDRAHAERVPLPWLSCMVDDCIKRGLTTEQGGAVYNFTGPQCFGIANAADSLYAVRELVYNRHYITLEEYRRAMMLNFGKGLDSVSAANIASAVARKLTEEGRKLDENDIALIIANVQNSVSDEDRKKFDELLNEIDALPKYGNDIEEVDFFARETAYLYTKPLNSYKNPRGGVYQAGIYPVSANVPLGEQTGATPDGRLAHTPVADGIGPMAGRDTNGPTATANSVARIDHGIASNGTLLNQKFHPSALQGEKGLSDFGNLIRTYFDNKGMHMQFNVIDRETLLDAQKNPDKYRALVVRVAGYSALFTTLSKNLQDDIIRRTEQTALLE